MVVPDDPTQTDESFVASPLAAEMFRVIAAFPLRD